MNAETRPEWCPAPSEPCEAPRCVLLVPECTTAAPAPNGGAA